MGDPHNQDVIKAIFIKNNIVFVIEVRRSATIDVADK
jgi:hypothetical protein